MQKDRLQAHESVNQEGLRDLRLLLCRAEGFEFEFKDDNYIADGSWGDVWIVYSGEISMAMQRAFPDCNLGPGVAVKFPRTGIEDAFLRDEMLADDCLDEEVTVGLKQLAVGAPSVLSALWAEVEDGRIYFSPYRKSEEAVKTVVMPLFGETLAEALSEESIEDDLAREVMEDLMARMFQMFEPVIGEGYFSLGNVKGVQDLIVDPRMKKYAEGGEIWRHYAFADRAEGVNDNLCWWIDELKEVLEQRLVDGKFGAQHGDPRPVNVALVEKDDGGVAAVLMDAVRLALRTEDAPDGRVMKEWFMTDVLLQGGTALGKMLALGQNAWFKTGVEEFAEQFGEDIFDDRHLGLLFGVGLAYGISVEIHVLGYQWEEAFKGGDVAEVYRLNDELEIFWHAIEDLANNPNSWKKYYE